MFQYSSDPGAEPNWRGELPEPDRTRAFAIEMERVTLESRGANTDHLIAERRRFRLQVDRIRRAKKRKPSQ